MKKRYAYLITILLLPSICFGTAYYVDPTDTGSTAAGTYAEPFYTVAQVNATTFTDGDDLYFKVGTELDLPSGQHLAIDWDGVDEDNKLTIGAYYGDGLFGLNGNARPILDGQLANSQAIIYGDLSADDKVGYVEIKDLEIKNSKTYGIWLFGYKWGATIGHTADYNEISNCYIHDGVNQAILARGIRYSSIVDNEIGPQPEPYRIGGSIVLQGNKGDADDDMTSYNTIARNIISGTGSEGIGTPWGANYNIIEDNVITNFGNVAIYVDGSKGNVYRRNIIIANTGDRGPDRGAGIWIETEAYPSPANSADHEVYDNYIAGVGEAIKISNEAGDPASYPSITSTGHNIYGNTLIDNDNNFSFNNINNFSDIHIYNNYSFANISTTGLVHSDNYSPSGVTWDSAAGGVGNFFNSAVTGNANDGDNPATNAYTLTNAGYSWREMDPDTIAVADFAITGLPAGPSEPTLNASNAYGGATYTPLKLYAFTEGSGTTVADIVGSNDATLTNPSWDTSGDEVLGVTMDSTGQVFAAPMASFGDDHSIFIAFTSTGMTSNDYGKWNYDPTAVRAFNFERVLSDTYYRWDTNSTSSYYTVSDVFDQYFHTMVYTSDDSGNSRCLYIDGALVSCETDAFTNPTYGSTLYYGAKNDGTRLIGVTFHLIAEYNSILTGADAASLHSDYDQMLTGAPTRTLNEDTSTATAVSGMFPAGHGGWGAGGQGQWK